MEKLDNVPKEFHMITPIIPLIMFVATIALFVIGGSHASASKKALIKVKSTQDDRYQSLSDQHANAAKLWRAGAGAACVAALVTLSLSCVYTQDVGETVVIRELGGRLVGSTEDAGFHFKAPWDTALKFDVRNNVVSFIKDASDDYFGGSANGPHVTVNDKGGASADIDIQVNYSLANDAATKLYEDYGTQENFVRSIVAVDVRSVPREVSGRFETITLLTNRSEFTDAIQEALSETWRKYGLIVEQVSVQEVRYPSSIVDSYTEAQAAEIAKQKALNQQEASKVDAQTKLEVAKIEAEEAVTRAQGEADANAILSASLTEEILRQNYIDTLATLGKSGNLVVVPAGTDPLVSVSTGE